jgi:hypothetical protein
MFQEILWFLHQEIQEDMKLLGLVNSVKGCIRRVEILGEQTSPFFPRIVVGHEYHKPVPSNPRKH